LSRTLTLGPRSRSVRDERTANGLDFRGFPSDSEQSVSVHKGWPPLGIGTAPCAGHQATATGRNRQGCSQPVRPFPLRSCALPNRNATLAAQAPKPTYTARRTHITEPSKTVTEELASGERIAALRARRHRHPLRLAHSQECRWYWPRFRRWPSLCPLLRSRNSTRRDSFRMDWFIGRRCGAIDTSGVRRGMHPRHPST
jgi:hypothetical protein